MWLLTILVLFWLICGGLNIIMKINFTMDDSKLQNTKKVIKPWERVDHR